MSRDASRVRTSRSPVRTSSMTSQTHQCHQSLNLNLVAASVAMGLSRKPRGRFPSFFACKLIWMRLLCIAKINRIGPISTNLGCLFITMATIWSFSQILFRDNALGPRLARPAKFQSDPSRNGTLVRWQCHKPYCFYCMIYQETCSSCANRNIFFKPWPALWSLITSTSGISI